MKNKGLTLNYYSKIIGKENYLKFHQKTFSGIIKKSGFIIDSRVGGSLINDKNTIKIWLISSKLYRAIRYSLNKKIDIVESYKTIEERDLIDYNNSLNYIKFN